MTSNHGDFSPEAREAATDKARAADIFAENAEVIVTALADVPDGHVLVAIVDDFHVFSGTHHVEQTDIVARVPELEGVGGWAMVFSPGIDVAAVRRRTDEMGSIARRRAEMITRILTRRG